MSQGPARAFLGGQKGLQETIRMGTEAEKLDSTESTCSIKSTLKFIGFIPQIILAFVVDGVGLLGFFLKHLHLLIEELCLVTGAQLVWTRWDAGRHCGDESPQE